MSFTKIKHAKGETLLEWKETDARQAVGHSLTSHDAPLPEFGAALQALTAYVLNVCELPIEYGDGLTIQSVSLGMDDTTGLGVVVTALKKLAGTQSPLVINTPYLTEIGSSIVSPTIPPQFLRLFEALEREATRYLKGERAQGDLFAKAA